MNSRLRLFLGGNFRAAAVSLLAGAAFAMPICVQAEINKPVRVEGGMISGTPAVEGVVVFKGIPYAAPPAGDLRWREPQPPVAWDGVRKADHFGNRCVQKPYEPGAWYQKEEYPDPAQIPEMSEDCLTVNVWTAAKSPAAKLPVIVWIHGGGFAVGSGAMQIYNGQAWAKRGVVVVTLNYRLGAFGFLAHPELTKESPHHISGNYGVLDQLAALKWVHNNIAAFGGDPGNVTIYGQSGGGRSVSMLMASPLARGLFQRAAGTSGGFTGRSSSLQEAEEKGAKFGESIQAPTLAALRAIPAQELLKASDRTGFRENIDGYYLVEEVYTTFSTGRQANVPVMVGSVANEQGNYPQPQTLKEYQEWTRRSYREGAEQVMKAFPASNDAEANAVYLRKAADSMAATMLMWADAMPKSTPAYLFWFDRKPPARPGEKRLGAVHTSEIPYFRSTLDAVTRPWEPEDRKLADTMTSYLVNFAATGNPNGKGLPNWPTYKAGEIMELGDHVGPIAAPDKSSVDFFVEYERNEMENSRSSLR